MATPARTIYFGPNHADDDPNRGYPTARDYYADVMTAGRTQRVSERLAPLRVQAAAGSDEQSGNEGQFGAFLVPIGFSPNLLTLPGADPTDALVMPVPMTHPQVGIPSRIDKDHTTSVSGGLIVTRKRETVFGTASRMGLEMCVLNANTLFGLDYFSREITEDSPLAMIATFEANFRDEMTAKQLLERLFGTGSGEPLGVMKSPCLISIAKEVGQVAGTVVTENIDKMAKQTWRYSSRATWLAHEDLLPGLMGLTRSVGVGGSIVNYLTWDDSGQARLLGRPIYFTEFNALPGTTGDLISGVWDQYLAGLLQPLQGLESVHLRFDTNDSAFKFTLRGDGCPWWKAPLQPRAGAALKSPFVTLATRA
jgi:HK97 family phage major capsid protein